MKQYCRYCGFCSEGDVYYCSAKSKVLPASALIRPNNCNDYGDCGIDIVTGKEHEPKDQKKRKKPVEDGEQMKI